MSSVHENDENLGVHPAGKHSDSEDTCDIFALEQPTGRPSILRQSQFENLTNKTVPKGIKVCFQTPRRDPVTKRIVSPSKNVKMTGLDDCISTLESLKLTSDESMSQENIENELVVSSSDTGGYPDDDMPIKSKGGYQLDFENLDTINPFQGSSTMAFSPARPCVGATVARSPVKSEPEVVENAPVSTAPVSTLESVPVEEEVVKTDSALDETIPFSASLENSVADTSTNVCSTDSPVIIDPKKLLTTQADQSLDDTEDLPKALSPAIPEPEAKPAPLPVSESVEETPLPARGTYSFDFDNLDAVNPFQIGGSKIPNSPALERNVEPVKSSPPKQEAQEQKSVESIPVVAESVVTEAPVLTEVKPVVEETSTSMETSVSQPTPAAETQVKLLEFNFDDGTEVKRKPPFKKLGKKPPVARGGAEKKPAPVEKKPVPPDVESKPTDAPAPKEDPQDGVPTETPLPKGSYSLDFDKLDDPNFNPFGTNAKVGGSVAGRQKPVPEQKQKKAEAPVQVLCAAPVAKIHPLQNYTEKQPSTDTAVSKMGEANETVIVEQIFEMVASPKPEVIQPPAPATCAASNSPKHDKTTIMLPEPTELVQQHQNPNLTTIGQDEEFVPGTTFMAGDFDGQFDYLEQFGSSTFQESALRKQSLYLKFDPLLRESPKKGTAGNSVGVSLSRPSLATRMDAQKPDEKKHTQSVPADSMKLLDFPAPSVQSVSPLTQDPAVLDLLVPTFKQPVKNEDAIIEVLKYSQKDMDAALAKAQEEAEERVNEWKAKCDALVQEKQQLGVVLADFDNTYAQIIDEREKEKQSAQEQLKKVLQEKEQALVDLNSMERSFSDLFKRLEKHKEVIEGYKKNEETLKMCAQDYMARIKKEEQRYKSLKAHAEEKISLANGEIAEVRGKHRSEVSALQAQLKREQLKVHSLEKTLDQKVKETEELTKLCDELIVNVQKN
ncbi:transforming acidic coiled-coil-containing protein 3 [Alosa pseudoharengus]|uniref:transforming acidic coiled-coil-containing protein 3 n=1 Tax=Alosa pseudoharengus TaxID=34774 RepID=UPI003F8B4839